MFSFMAETRRPFYKNFQGFTYCSVFKVHEPLGDVYEPSRFSILAKRALCATLSKCCFCCSQQQRLIFYHSCFCLSTTFLFIFSNHFGGAVLTGISVSVRVLVAKDRCYLTTTFDKSQHLFVVIFLIVLTAYTILLFHIFLW